MGGGKRAIEGFDVKMDLSLLPKDYHCRKSFLFSNSSKGRFVKMGRKQSSELYLEAPRKFSLCLEAGPALFPSELLASDLALMENLELKELQGECYLLKLSHE